MKEQDYIHAKALGTISSAIEVLKDICPENLEDIMTKDEYSSVLPTLINWRDRLFDKVLDEMND